MLSFKQKTDTLFDLIKSISDYYGGDDEDWLRGYCTDIIAGYHDRLDVAIKCFEDLKCLKVG